MNEKEFFTRYRFDSLNDKIGEGAFGTVYKAYDLVLDRQLAIKVAQVKYIEGKKFSLIDEVNATKSLPDHKHIANYENAYQIQMSNGLFDYAIMQYYEAGNLKELLETDELNDEQKHQLCKGLIKGLAFLHDNKIIHRDLKPSNILISKYQEEYSAKISDFGLSKLIADDDYSVISNSFGGGTLAYSSPEQLQGRKLGYRADIWSLGIILFEVWKGLRPFRADTQTGSMEGRRRQVFQQIVNAPIPDEVNACPYGYADVIRGCLVKDAAKRTSKASTLLDLIDVSKISVNVVGISPLFIPITNQSYEEETIIEPAEGSDIDVDQTVMLDERQIAIEKERIEQERLEQERIENDRIEKERIENERVEQDRIENNRIEKERLEQERIEKETAENERLEQERIEKEKEENERIEQEKIEKERIEKERIEKERFKLEIIEKEKLEKEQIELKKIEAKEREQKEEELRKTEQKKQAKIDREEKAKKQKEDQAKKDQEAKTKREQEAKAERERKEKAAKAKRDKQQKEEDRKRQLNRKQQKEQERQAEKRKIAKKKEQARIDRSRREAKAAAVKTASPKAQAEKAKSTGTPAKRQFKKRYALLLLLIPFGFGVNAVYNALITNDAEKELFVEGDGTENSSGKKGGPNTLVSYGVGDSNLNDNKSRGIDGTKTITEVSDPKNQKENIESANDSVAKSSVDESNELSKINGVHTIESGGIVHKQANKLDPEKDSDIKEKLIDQVNIPKETDYSEETTKEVDLDEQKQKIPPIDDKVNETTAKKAEKHENKLIPDIVTDPNADGQSDKSTVDNETNKRGEDVEKDIPSEIEYEVLKELNDIITNGNLSLKDIDSNVNLIMDRIMTIYGDETEFFINVAGEEKIQVFKPIKKYLKEGILINSIKINDIKTGENGITKIIFHDKMLKND